VADMDWSNLVIERRSAPTPLADADFESWMEGRPIFISSVIDEETHPLREAARDAITRLGGVPVMWEGITPRDQKAEDAFLEGVDRTTLFVLLVGTRYGVTDESGYSATHKETVRAGELAIPRLLFEFATASQKRDGRLNDWIRSLYNEVSTAKIADAGHLRDLLDVRLRELAATQERTWVKLGRLLFPASVHRASDRSGVAVTIAASIADPGLRRALNDLAGNPHRAGDILTYGESSEAVAVQRIAIDSSIASRIEVAIECRSESAARSLGRAVLFGTVSTGGRSYGAAEQVVLWARRRLLGARASSLPDFLRTILGADDAATLPAALESNSASGWIAEGITRAFTVEGILGEFGGYFDRLDIGPATASGIRVRFVHVSGSKDAAHFDDVVPLVPNEPDEG
jgi:hypothetical protein